MSYFPSPSYHHNPRTRYLAALAEAEAAETEYLAAEAARREEDVLRRRLEEIQLRKQEQGLLRYNSHTRFPELNAHPVAYRNSRLEVLRQQVEEEEERLRLFALREARYKREEEETRLLTLRRQLQTTLPQMQREEALTGTNLERNDFGRRSSESVKHQKHDLLNPHSIFIHPALQSILVPEAQAIGQAEVAPPATHASPCRYAPVLHNNPTHNYICPKAKVDPRELFDIRPDALPRPDPRASGAACNSTKPAQQERHQESLGYLFNLLAPLQSAQLETSSTSQNKVESLRHSLSSTGLPFSEETKPTQLSACPTQIEQKCAENHKTRTTPIINATGASSSETSIKQQLEARFNDEYYSEAKDIIQAIFASLQDAKPILSSEIPPTTSTQAGIHKKARPAASVETSLQEQLATRLNGELDAEMRDTIQAIFASLQDAKRSPEAKAETSKGKEKSIEVSPTTPTSRDVVNSMDQVHSIETAFQTLEDDFVFPQQLDFIASHIAAGSSPTSTDSETSPTTHLAYTSRNHPVRFYEQALSGLLTQLDSIDSFGNEDVRERRKSVVVRVERALEELEREVEGRWKGRINKEAKAIGIQAANLTVGQVSENQPQVDLQTTQVAATEPSLKHATPESASTASSPTPEASISPDNSDEKVVASAATHRSTSSAEILPLTSKLQAAQGADSADITAISIPAATSALIPPGDSDDALPSTESASTSEAYSFATTNAPDVAHGTLSNSATSIAVSEVIPKGEDHSAHITLPVEAEPDAFLLTASEGESIPRRPNNRESDDGASDWSEIES